MKKSLWLFVVLAEVLIVLSASAKESPVMKYVDGTVVRVERHEVSPAQIGGQNPSDAPLADPETYAYDVAVRIKCGTYVGRYHSWYDYIPSVFKPDQRIQVRLSRSVIYVNVPNEKDAELNIVSKHIEHGPCEIAKR